MITFDDPLSILFVSVERATTPRFVELAHTLNHLQKLHYVVVDEAHLLLSDFRPVMKGLFVATLALGSRPRQRGCKGAGQEEARESHQRLPGV